jgi:hypothetical protein
MYETEIKDNSSPKFDAKQTDSTQTIFPANVFKLIRPLRLIMFKLFIFLSYFGIIFVPIIIYANLINKLEWGKYDHKPTPESIVKFKEIGRYQYHLLLFKQ